MTEIGRCGDCRHYRPEERRPYGECNLIEEMDGWDRVVQQGEVLAYVPAVDEGWAYLCAHEDFGCVQFQPKTESEGEGTSKLG